MASIRKEILLDAPAAEVWDALRDFGAVHERVAPGFLVGCTLEGDARVVTFANGAVAREVLVDLDDSTRRLVYAIETERITHYNAALQVFAEGERRTRLVWTVDMLPHDIKDYITRQMDDAIRAIESTFMNRSSL